MKYCGHRLYCNGIQVKIYFIDMIMYLFSDISHQKGLKHKDRRLGIIVQLLKVEIYMESKYSIKRTLNQKKEDFCRLDKKWTEMNIKSTNVSCFIGMLSVINWRETITDYLPIRTSQETRPVNHWQKDRRLLRQDLDTRDIRQRLKQQKRETDSEKSCHRCPELQEKGFC